MAVIVTVVVVMPLVGEGRCGETENSRPDQQR